MPIAPPNSAFRAASTINTFGSGAYIMAPIINRGASFCHVDRIRQDIHEMEDITDGYHVWQGAAPSFSIRDRRRIVEKKEGGRFVAIHRDILLISIKLEPSACARKYLIEASDSLLVFEYIIIGINARRLISSLAHT